MSALVVENTQIAKQFDYKTFRSTYPVYRHSKLLPQSGTQFVGLNTTGTQETLFEIPTKVFNPSECILSWTRGVAAQAAFSWVFQDTVGEIQQLQLYTRNGKYICDINNFNNYMKVSRKLSTPFTKLVSADQKSTLYPSNQVPQAGQRFDGTANNVAINETDYFSISTNAAAYYDFIQLR